MNKGEAQQIIDGAMLGDAGIAVNKKIKNPTPCFAYGQTGSEHNDSILRVQVALNVLGVETSAIKPYKGDGYSSGYYTKFHTHVCDYIRNLYHRWYPSGKKVVPTDSRLTSLMLAQFYMDDGTSTYHQCNDGVNVHLCSQGFTFAENVFLRRQLYDFGIECTVTYSRDGRLYSISIRQRGIDKFMDIVDEHVLPSFRYKVKRRGTHIAADFKAMRKRLGKI